MLSHNVGRRHVEADSALIPVGAGDRPLPCDRKLLKRSGIQTVNAGAILLAEPTDVVCRSDGRHPGRSGSRATEKFLLRTRLSRNHRLTVNARKRSVVAIPSTRAARRRLVSGAMVGPSDAFQFTAARPALRPALKCG